jgi:hypothetical protein
MAKPARILLACAVLISALSLSIVSPLSSVRAQAGGSAANLEVYVAPSKVVCLGETAPIGLFYYWEVSASALAPLTRGTLVTSASHGSVDKPSLSAGLGPGMARLVYTPADAGSEVVISTLTYGSLGNATVKMPFKVKKCNYRLSIRAADVKDTADVTITSWFESVGNISVSGSVNGELPASIGFGISSNNDVVTCDLEPPQQGSSSLTVSGHTSTDVDGNMSVHLTIAYQAFPAGKPSNEVCADKPNNVQIRNIPFPAVPSYDPSTDLLTTLDFAPGQTFIKGSFGAGGTAYYNLTPVDDSSSGQ